MRREKGNGKLIWMESVDSTNEEIKRRAALQAPEGTIVTADMQTAGKGRKGRTWQSPAGKNLYFSILLRPTVEKNHASMLTLLMALAVQKAVTSLSGTQADIKWPNDVIMHGKKIAGILTEMYLKDDDIDFVVIGTGINVKKQAFPEELVNAGSIEDESGRMIDRESLLHQVAEEFQTLYETFLKTESLSFARDDYEKALVSKDREVLVFDPAGEYRGFALGISENGELLVRMADGSIKNIYAGEVSVRGVYGYV